MERRKLYALGAIALIALVMSVAETAMTGHVETLSVYGVIESALAIPLMYWWYYMDKQQTGYKAGPLMNVGVIAVAVIAFPIYFIRSRGWRRGAITTVQAGCFLGAVYLLEMLGETIGKAVAS